LVESSNSPTGAVQKAHKVDLGRGGCASDEPATLLAGATPSGGGETASPSHAHDKSSESGDGIRASSDEDKSSRKEEAVAAAAEGPHQVIPAQSHRPSSPRSNIDAIFSTSSSSSSSNSAVVAEMKALSAGILAAIDLLNAALDETNVHRKVRMLMR
jgi:hypothetical protein